MDSSFPPSPQWHQPHSACLCCVSEETGWLLYSLNNSIHILNPFSLKYQGILENGHSARINAIAARPFTPQTSDHESSRLTAATILEGDDITVGVRHEVNSQVPSSDHHRDPDPRRPLVASGGDDLKVVCWDVSTQRVFSSQKKLHQKPVKAVGWTGDRRFIVSGDKGGVIVVWSPFQGKTNKKQLPDKPSISCVSASPAHPDTVAFGLDGGDILVCQANLTHIVILRRLHGHSENIQSLSWQPRSDPHDRSYSLLASGCADQTIRIWDIEKEISVKIIGMPETDKSLAPYQRTKAWVPVAWASRGNEIVSFTSRGSMVRWLLDKDPRSYTKTLRGKVHNRVVYQIMMWPLGGFAFTISMDRRIIAWDMDTNQGVAHIECIGGNVYALEANPLDPGRIAVGLGNETIKVWNTLSKDEPYECVTVERLQTKVRAVKWHPIEEETLCFGLENGKIGMIKNILGGTSHHYQQQQQRQGKKAKQGSKSKDKMGHVQVVFQSYHEGAVVSMSWCTPKAFEAPVPELFDLSLRDSAVCVISIGSEGKILVTDTSKPASRSLDLESVIQRQNVAWYESRRAIKGGDTPPRRDFALHPNEDLLAIGNDDGSVEIFELQYFKLVYVFQGHRRRVNRLKWSWSGAAVSDESDERDVASYLLASGSDDGALAIHDLRQFSAKAHAEKRQRDKQLMADREEQGSSAADTEGISSTSFFLAANAGTVLPTARAYAYFSYHSRGIADLAWSPHGSWEASDTATFQKLVAVSFDGKAIVYQVQVDSGDDDTLSVPRQHTALACYDRHEGQILSVLWSMSDIDQIYTGGNDWRISVWNWKSFKLSEPQVDALKRSGGSSSFQVEGKGTAAKSLLPAVKPQAVPETKAGLHQSNQGHLELERNHQGRIKQVNQASSEIPLDETQRGPMAAEDAVETVSTKRVGETVLQSEIVSSKKARTQSNKLVSTLPPVAMATLKGVDLFPLSSENFQYRLRKQVHLEIIRLTRNLYCRRFGHGGFLTRDEDIVAARGRWRQMRQFFESDGEEEALTLSRILGQDIDEMNLDDDVEEVEQGEPFTPEQRMEQVRPGDGTKPSENKIPITLDASQRGMEQEEQRLPDEEDLHEKEVICTEEDSVADTGAGNPGGDLVFYGSRESIKALAEMEAQQVSKIHAGSSAQLQHHSNIFSVGGGMGVVVAPNYGQRDTASLTKSKKTAHLGQVPISYWMGDVPKMMDILSVLPDSTLGTHDWIGLALSPMGGVEAWRTMMSRTAIKCESAGETHAAVLCHLGIGRVYEAVDAYRKKEMYREALMLLRIRLWDDEDFDEPSESDGQADLLGHKNSDTAQNTEGQRFLLSNRQLSMLHVQILTEWGQYLERRNRFEQACKCQLTLAALLIKGSSVLGNQTVLQSTPSVALQTLARRGDVATLRIVAGLAILLDDPFRQERIQQYEVLQTRLKSNSLLPKN